MERTSCSASGRSIKWPQMLSCLFFWKLMLQKHFFKTSSNILLFTAYGKLVTQEAILVPKLSWWTQFSWSFIFIISTMAWLPLWWNTDSRSYSSIGDSLYLSSSWDCILIVSFILGAPWLPLELFFLSPITCLCPDPVLGITENQLSYPEGCHFALGQRPFHCLLG